LELEFLSGVTPPAAAPAETKAAVTHSEGTPPAKKSVGEIEKDQITNSSKWLDGLDESLRTDPSLRRFEDVGSLAKSYAELRKSVGKNPFPNEKTSETELQDFWRKAGIPDKEKYNLDVKKYNLPDDVGGKIKELAATNGVTEKGLSSIFDYIQEVDAKQKEEAVAHHSAIITEQVEQLKAEYGQAFDKYRKLAGEVAKDIYSPEEMQVLNERGILKDPLFAKAFMKLAQEKFSEETVDDDGVHSGAMTPDQAKARIKEILSDPDYSRKTSARFKSLVDENLKLHAYLRAGE